MASLDFSLLSFSPFACHCLLGWVELRRWVLGRGFDEVGWEDHVEGAIHDHLKDLVNGNKVVIDHRAIAKFLALCQLTLNPDFHCIENLCWKVALGGDAPFENYLLHLDCVGKKVDLSNGELKKNGSDHRLVAHHVG